MKNLQSRNYNLFMEDDIFEFEDQNLRRTIDLNFDFDCDSQSETIESCVQDQKRAIMRSLHETECRLMPRKRKRGFIGAKRNW